MDNMQVSPVVEGTHATSSTTGAYIASIGSSKLTIHTTAVPEQRSEVAFRIPQHEITALKWDGANTQVLLFSPQHIEIVDLLDPSHRVKLDNGSGGLGRFASADFVSEDLVFVIWEFGRSKLWNLRTGKGIELNDVKGRVGGLKWQLRPRGQGRSYDVMAMLSRSNGEDFLLLYFPATESSMPITKLPTVDAQNLSWSADGRWLVVVDTPHASAAVHVYTADGHHFRSYGSTAASDQPDPGVKDAVWSADHKVLAVPKHDGAVPLLNTRTFSPTATIEHNTTINQLSITPDKRATIFEEVVSASGERTYRVASQPFSPPLSDAAKLADHHAKGVVDCLFSGDGSFLATRDERMLNTLWIWNMDTFAAHSVIVQHNNIRRIEWHPARTSALLLECGEGIVYMYDASNVSAPAVMSVPSLVAPSLRWIQTTTHNTPAILATSKIAFCVLFPEGNGVSDAHPIASRISTGAFANAANSGAGFEEGNSEDSLFDVLSGRKPQYDARDREMSYTERIDLETEAEDSTARLDDTFREKRQPRPLSEELEKDPFDDSQIF